MANPTPLRTRGAPSDETVSDTLPRPVRAADIRPGRRRRHDGSAGGRPRETHEGSGFFAYSSDCDARTCTDTYVYADEVTTSSGETYESVCVEQYTYSTRTGQTTDYSFGCSDTTNLAVADDLSSATLSPTDVEVCDGRRCETVTVSAELAGSGETATYRSRHSFKDGTCTFTYSDSGEQRFATGTITVDGETTDAQGEIRSWKSTFSKRCR